MLKFVKGISIVLCLFFIVSVGFTGCGGSSKSSESTTAAQTETTAKQAESSTEAKAEVPWDTGKNDTVVFSVINNYYTAGLKKLAEDYTRLHPETKVQIDIISDNSTYATNYTTKINADKKTAPDIIHVNVAGANSTWVDKGWLIDLSRVIDEINPYANDQKVRDVIDQEWLTFSINQCQNKLFYLPFDLVGVGMYYNISIFEREGLQPPKTIEDLIDLCKVLKDKGYDAPIGANNVWGWYPTMFADQAYRSLWKDMVTLPGDAIWDENAMKPNLDVQYSPDNMTFDAFLQLNTEKKYAYLLKNGVVNDASKKIWTAMLELCKYFQKGFISPDEQQVNAGFIAQKHPMMIHGSWIVGKFVDDVKKLPADKQFKWAVFQLPPFKDGGSDFPGKMRSLLVPGNLMGCTNKDDADHNARVLDVLKYMYSPQVAQMVYNETLSNGNYVQGPSLIKGVQLSDEINGYLDGFRAAGNMRWDFDTFIVRPDMALKDELPKANKIMLDAVDGKITLDEFLKMTGEINMTKLKKEYEDQGFDGDPKTKDTPKQ